MYIFPVVTTEIKNCVWDLLGKAQTKLQLTLLIYLRPLTFALRRKYCSAVTKIFWKWGFIDDSPPYDMALFNFWFSQGLVVLQALILLGDNWDIISMTISVFFMSTKTPNWTKFHSILGRSFNFLHNLKKIEKTW